MRRDQITDQHRNPGHYLTWEQDICNFIRNRTYVDKMDAPAVSTPMLRLPSDVACCERPGLAATIIRLWAVLGRQYFALAGPQKATCSSL